MPNRSLLMVTRVDALPRIGVGHAVRQLALAEAWLGRGHRMVLVGELSIPWVRDAWLDLDVELLSSAQNMFALRPDVVMLDGYHLPRSLGSALLEQGIPVVTMVDGPFGLAQPASLYVDQNLGADSVSDRTMLLGTSYALLRDSVLAARERVRPKNEVPRVLVVFGGTDAFDGCVSLVRGLVNVGVPCQIDAVAATPDIGRRLERLSRPESVQLRVLPPVRDLPGLASECDVVVTAAGTSVWEFLCVGVPIGLVCVTDNQRVGYDVCVDRGVVVGIGHLADLKQDATRALPRLQRLLSDDELRSNLCQTGRTLVDGRGKVRVSDAVERLIGW